MTLPQISQNVWQPASEADKAQALASLSMLQSRAVGDRDLVRASYYAALEGVTRYSLAEAVKAIMKNALGHSFMPSPPELRGQCDKAMEWPERERERIRRREQIERERPPVRPEPTQAEKARVAALNSQFQRAADSDGAAAREAAERAEIRARYGMTDDVLAAIKDQPVPSNFKQPTVRVKCS